MAFFNKFWINVFETDSASFQSHPRTKPWGNSLLERSVKLTTFLPSPPHLTQTTVLPAFGIFPYNRLTILSTRMLAMETPWAG
jgi:hypothetical protein